MIRILIVDDEPLAREKIRIHAARDPEVEIVGECSCGAEAVEAITTLLPDLVFLDVQMPEMDGLEVAEAIPEEIRPDFVFVTAHSRYAALAVQAGAFECILKPFDGGQIIGVLNRVRSRRDER